jgi:hypothetical protein
MPKPISVARWRWLRAGAAFVLLCLYLIGMGLSRLGVVDNYRHHSR